MNYRVWTLGIFAAWASAFVACSTEVAGSSLETENSVAVQVLKSDGTPAARTKVLVRPSDYLVGNPVKFTTQCSYLSDTESFCDTIWVNSENSTYGVTEYTDDEGRIVIKDLSYNSKYTVEAQGESYKAAVLFNHEQPTQDGVVDSITMKLSEPGAASGQISFNVDSIPDGAKIKVYVVGFEYSADVDENGKFVFTSLPEGEFLFLARYVSEDSSFSGTLTHKISSGKNESVNIPIELPPDPDSLIYILEDFEIGVDKWYKTHSRYAEVPVMETVEMEDREGAVAHVVYSSDSLYTWTGIGSYLGGILDLSDMDSVAFYAKGEGAVSISFDYIEGEGVKDGAMVDSVSRDSSGKAWRHIQLASVWTRYVVPVDSFISAEDKNGGNIGWDSVKTRVTNITVFGTVGD